MRIETLVSFLFVSCVCCMFLLPSATLLSSPLHKHGKYCGLVKRSPRLIHVLPSGLQSMTMKHLKLINFLTHPLLVIL